MFSRQSVTQVTYALVNRATSYANQIGDDEGWSNFLSRDHSPNANGSKRNVRRTKYITSVIGLLILSSVAIAGHNRLEKGPAKVIDFDFEGDYSGLAALCNNTRWVDNRTIWCHPMLGGFANVRSAILNCVRYTIESGSNLVEPVIRQRTTDIQIGLEGFYDVSHFRQVLKHNCPQMTLIQEEELGASYQWDREDFPDPYLIKDVYKDAGGTRTPSQPSWNEETKTFRQDFDKVMASRTAPRIVSGVVVPVVYRLQWPLFLEWPVEVDPPEFWTNFGKILKFRKEDIALASEVYTSMVEQLGPLYFGAHLRSEYDIVGNNDFTSPEKQTSTYIQMCKDRGLTTMYAAAGDMATLEALKKAAGEHDIVVVNKYHLMSPDSLAQYLTRTFDHQAIVDYMVLLKSDFFAGVAMSSFSSDIAARRHVLANLPGSFDALKPDGQSLLLDEAWGGRFSVTMYP